MKIGSVLLLFGAIVMVFSVAVWLNLSNKGVDLESQAASGNIHNFAADLNSLTYRGDGGERVDTDAIKGKIEKNNFQKFIVLSIGLILGAFLIILGFAINKKEVEKRSNSKSL